MYRKNKFKKENEKGVKKNADVVSLAEEEAREKMTVRKISTKKYEVAVDTGERYPSGRKKIKKEMVNGNKPDALEREKELLEEVKALRTAVEQLRPVTGNESSNKTFREIAERWIVVKQLEISENTWSRYRGIIYNHLVPFLGKKVMANINIEDIEDYYIAKKEIKLSQHKVIIDNIFKYAAKIKKIISKEHARDIEEISCPAWYEEEIDCITDEKELSKMLISLQNSVVFLPTYLALATGARLGEIIALQWKDIDFIKNTVTIRKTNFHKKVGNEFVLKKKSTKNKNIRTLKITEKDVEVLQYFREKQNGKDDDYVCLNSQGKPHKSSTLSANFKCRAKSKGYDISFHSLRHSHGTMLAYHSATEKYILYRLGDTDTRMAKRYTRILYNLEDPLALAATEKVTKNISFDTENDTNSKKQLKVVPNKQKTKKRTALLSDVKMGGHTISKSGAGKRT